MLVTVTGFGSVWRWRLRKAPGHGQRLAESAYYNTTGVEISGSIRQRPKIVGYVRFNGRGGFDPNHPSRMINRVFECADPCVWRGQNKLLFKRMLTAPQKPDLFLVVVRPELTGVLRVGGANWRSDDSWLIAFSEFHDQQEAMLLLPAYGWIQIELGRFVLEPATGRPWVGGLCWRAESRRRHMRYWKGSIALSPTQDYPLLCQVLHSGFVTSAQLYEFLKLDYCASSRDAFFNRVRRLVKHELLVRHEFPAMTRGVVYSISEAGASELIGRGEYYPARADHATESNGHAHHALELNEIHLALKRTGTLIRWTPETDIRSQNEFTNIGYWKDYDAVISVRVGELECRFALEYERTPKSKRQYTLIQSRIESERGIPHFLYLAPNHDLLLFLVRRFESCRRPVYFGLWEDFLIHTLGLTVRSNRSPVSTTLRAVLAVKPTSQYGKTLPVA